MTTASYTLPGGVGFCNAVRRTLLSDVRSWAPHSVTMTRNTSVQTDEFLAHRIGLIPFRKVGNGDTMTLDVKGPIMVTAADLTGPAFEAVHPEIEILLLGKDQHLSMTVHFDEQPAGKHARYSMCAGVGMRQIDADRYQISFTTNNGRSTQEVLSEALDHLDARVQRALHALAHQPAVPPKSFC